VTGALLHARCHRVAVVAVLTLVGALVVALVPSDGLDGTTLAPLLSGVLTLAATAGALALEGPDPDLDLAAARPRPPRRAGALLGLAGGAVGLCWLLDARHGVLVPLELIVRNGAGQLGLLGIGTVLLGGALGWLLPLAAAAAAALPGTGAVAGWLAQPADSRPAALTATTAALLGLAAYTTWGAHARG
jgi:hypothetical protein